MQYEFTFVILYYFESIDDHVHELIPKSPKSVWAGVSHYIGDKSGGTACSTKFDMGRRISGFGHLGLVIKNNVEPRLRKLPSQQRARQTMNTEIQSAMVQSAAPLTPNSRIENESNAHF